MDVIAPAHWACIDFISDLHLQASEPATYRAWAQYLQRTRADALFILGDLFEVWVGDDMIGDPVGFEAQCVQHLASARARLALFIMHGNRDFLMGSALMRAANATLLDDPSVLEFGGQRWMLSHGDAWCLDDHEYMQFRAKVRSTAWQQAFLAQPLAERQRIAQDLRSQSKAKKQLASTVYADVDTTAALTAMQSHNAQHLIHGHTHRPACHTLNAKQRRWVLSDWDAAAIQPRAEVLRLRAHPCAAHTCSITLERLPLSMA